MTIDDFIELLNNSKSNVENLLETLSLSENFVDTIKIKTDSWGSASSLNVHAAQYMQAVQKDVLSAWNMATGQHVTLASLNDYPFLIVTFNIHNGSLNFEQCIKILNTVMKDLSPIQKMLVYTMIFCSVLAVSTAFGVRSLAESGFFDSDEIKKLKLLSQNKESTKIIINNLGNGTVVYNGTEWDIEALKKDRKSIELMPIIENVAIDGVFIIDICKLESGIHLISKDGKQFNADHDTLDPAKRKILTDRLAEAMLEKKNLEQAFRIDAKQKDGVIIDAHIIDIDQPPRAHASKIVLKQNPQKPLEQGSLLE